MRVTPTLRFARALRDDTEPRSAYTATIWWLFAFVGLANWFFVFCLFVQVPVLIAVKGGHEAGGLPEGIRLSSFLNVFQQLGNGVALVMMFSLRASAIPTFGTLLLLAAVAASATMAALLPCANNLSVDASGCDNGFIVRTVWGHRRSVGIWAAAFVSGVIGSSGNLIVVPYMSRFRSGYTSAYFAGTGLSGIFASALAAAQVWDASDASPNFGPDTFCAVVSASCSASLVAWLAIVKMDYDFDAAEAALYSAGATGHGHTPHAGNTRHGHARPGGQPGRDGNPDADAWEQRPVAGTAERDGDARVDAATVAGAGRDARNLNHASAVERERRQRRGPGVAGAATPDAAALAAASHAAAAALAVHGATAEDYDGEEDLSDDLNGAEEGGRPGIGGGGGGGARRPSHRGASMLRRVAPVMAVSCAAGVANYGLCVPARLAAELLAESSGYPNLPTMVNVVYYVATRRVRDGRCDTRPRGGTDRVRAWVLAIGSCCGRGCRRERGGGGGGGDGYTRDGRRRGGWIGARSPDGRRGG